MSRFKLRKSWDTAILAFLFVVWVLASLTTDNFLSSINVSQIFSNSSEIMIMRLCHDFLIIAGEDRFSLSHQSLP
jgi:ribose/xylose/arabinose/galactoside ABC-type transport system permease subunit